MFKPNLKDELNENIMNYRKEISEKYLEIAIEYVTEEIRRFSKFGKSSISFSYIFPLNHISSIELETIFILLENHFQSQGLNAIKTKSTLELSW